MGHMPPETLTLRLFGRARLDADSAPVEVRGALPLAIVARLALLDGATMSAIDLIDAIWEEPPPTASGSLRAYLSRLRDHLGSRLSGGRGGYALAIDSVDVLEFRRAARAGDIERAVALWGGDPLADIDAPFAAGVRAELLDLYRGCWEALAAERLISGDLADVLTALPGLVEAHPEHEEPVRLLATALARSGRVAEALDVIDALIARLAESRGLDPSAAITDLRLAIVRQDASVLPVASGRVIQHGVPLPSTSFVGRATELEHLREAREGARLVTLTGPGGVGKSRLALESLRSDPTGEQWMLELASFAPGDDVVAALAELLGVTSYSVEALGSRLSGTGNVLVLDNAEHLLRDVAPLVTNLLAHTPGLSVLVTSREPLRVPGEKLVAVPPMTGDGVALFADRARDADPTFTLDGSTGLAVSRLVEVLDALPLALELTAARLDVMSVGDLLESSGLVMGGPGDERHSSLRNTIEWSVRLLDASELELLAQLATFSGAVTMAAVAAVCDLGGADVRVVAASLAQKSLLAVEGASADTRRYRLLEAVKLYARELESADDAAARQVRHGAWFADRVDELAKEARGPHAPTAQAELDSMRPDTLSAIASAMERGDRSLAVRLTGGLAWHWYRRSSLVEGIRLIDAALALPGEELAHVDARAAWGTALMASRVRVPRWEERVAASVGVAERSADDGLLALSLSCFAMYFSSAQPPAARDAADRAELLLEDLEPATRSEVLIFLGGYRVNTGHAFEAMRSYQQAMQLAMDARYRSGVLSARWQLILTLLAVGRGQDALDQFIAAIPDLALDHDPLSMAQALAAGAAALASTERHADAARAFGAADRIAHDHGFALNTYNDERMRELRALSRQTLRARHWNAAYTAGIGMKPEHVIELIRVIGRPVGRT
jgi:predicted ATPase/DNA-binding SARP family transcriptional activator